MLNIQMNLDREGEQMIGLPEKVIRKKNPFYEATELEKKGQLQKAEALYQEMLCSDFGNSVILAALGMNNAVQGRHGLAYTLLSKALEVFDSRFEKDLESVGIGMKDEKTRAHFVKVKKSEIMNAIGTTWKQENNVAKARYWFEKAQSYLDSPNPDIQNNLATLFINEGKPELSIPYCDRAIAVDPNHSQAHWNRSLAYLELGDYERGFADYKWGKRAQVRMERNYYAQGETPEWDGTPGKTVVIYGEQGIGDEIMFASCINDAKAICKEVIFECHKKLHRLFMNSFPDIDCWPTREDETVTWPITDTGPRYNIDAKIAIGDLPKLFRKKIEDFPGTPYIEPTRAAQEKWARVLNDRFPDKKPVIGINWIGGMKKTRVEVRSLSLEKLLPVLSQDAHFVSLQYTPCEDEIYEFEAKHGIHIHHWPECSYNEHYDETAGMVANLDLVITCCSSIVHLAGSMGVPTWVLTPSRPAWRYRLDLPNMPWYGNTILLLRQEPGTTDWEPVVADAAVCLTELITATLPDKEIA